MYRKIMVGYRPDSHGEDALALGRVLVAGAGVRNVVVAQVLDDEDARQEAQRRLRQVAEGWPHDASVSTQAVTGDSVGDTLRAVAEEERVDALVLGSTHRGLAGRVFLGTTAGDVFPDASCPVLVAPRGYREKAGRLARIGVAFDGSTEAQAALDWAVALATAANAVLRLIAIAEPPPPPAETWAGNVPGDAWADGLTFAETSEMIDISRRRREHELELARASVGPTTVETTTVVGDAVHELRAAAADLDLVAVGSHRRGRFESALMGSVSRGLAKSCPAPLAVVPSAAPNIAGAPSTSSAA